MHRAMTGFRRDDDGDWVAELSCLHAQHIRHQPPFAEAAWIEDDDERRRRIGEPLECPLCDRAELPDGLHVARTTATWDASTMPPALRRAHRVAAGTWGLLEVEVGVVRFVADTDPPIDVMVTPARPQPIPPEVDHQVAPDAGARFRVTFLTTPAEDRTDGG
jgi:tellurite methyltransferase